MEFWENSPCIGINVGKAGREARGITIYTHNILREFNKIGPNCRFVLLYYPDSRPENEIGDGARLEALLFTETKSPFTTIISEQVLNPLHQKRLALDVVWHPHNRFQYFTPVKYVATLHDVLPIAKPQLASAYLNSRAKRALYMSRTMAARSADMIITASEFSRNEIIRHLRIDRDKITVIPSGIDREVFHPPTDQKDVELVKSRYMLPQRYLLTTGSYAPHKNQKTVLDAYGASRLPHEGVGLVMVGPNDATGYAIGYACIKERVQALRLEDKVRLLPAVPLQDLVTIYGGAEFFVTASLYEGFGFTPLEAMACGVPVVASNAASIPEVCGDAVLYSEPLAALSFADHFDVLLNNVQLRKALVERGFCQASRFDWRTTAEKTLAVLRETAMS